jgi:short-subunit dehydrogenase
MKIAVTGHTQGLGKSLYKELVKQDHDVLGLSLENGYDINNISNIIDAIESSDCFINNAQDNFKQTELFLALSKKWLNVPGKKIINIGSLILSLPTTPYDSWHDIVYYTQKKALAESVKQVRNLKYNWPKICLINPGPLQTEHTSGMDTDQFAQEVLRIITNSNFAIEEISIGLIDAWK